ncbi:girdin isoform X2 [Venturia canescens]|uniref:girdin isoform X2 n=1 Tax=Venturia canescens TaxID=32260 RepID=UPI001C9C763D|nr:girdin isoform X2 [Venturia canescens]
MASSQIDEFLAGPLVTWFVSCLEDPDSLTNYNDLVDGVLLHSVFLQIDPEPLYDGVVPTGGNHTLRAKNLKTIVGNIKQFYEEELGHLIIKQPDTENLGKEPESHVQDARLLLLLLLGCAVQCPNKKQFITKIKTLNLDTQLAIVDCIKQVTDQPDIVITQDSMENANLAGLFKQIKQLLQERDLYREKCAVINNMSGTNDCPVDPESEEGVKKAQSTQAKLEREENHHFAVELADWKSKVRKQRQELEEKTEALLECKEELEHNKASLAKLKQENQELMHEARTAKSYRDELDAVNERAERADRLEMEVARYREKLTDIEFYKTRIEELREDNRVLMENREMLEEQLNSSRRRADKVLELEAQIIEYKQLVNEMALERTAEKEKYQELFEENSQLHRLKKAAAEEAALAGSISETEEPDTSDNRLSEQLTNNAQTRALKLELENRRLNTLIDTLKENSFHETSSRVLELEKEKKKLSLKIESLNDGNERLCQQNSDLELVCRQALEENKKLQDTLKNQRASFERQQQEYQIQHNKILQLENNYDGVIKEKQRIQSLLESVQRRADDLDRSLEIANQKLEGLKNVENSAEKTESKCSELEMKIAMLEKDKESALRDIYKYRETIEEKDVALDTSTNNVEVLERRVSQLENERDVYIEQITRLQEIERSSKELDSRAAIDRETLETLQSNLVAEKLNSQRLYTVLEKFGLNAEMLLTLPSDNILKRISQIPEVVEYIKSSIVTETTCNCNEKMPDVKVVASAYDASVNMNLQEIIETQRREIENLSKRSNTSQARAEQLKSEKAQLQVSVTTLQSQSTSLTTQHTALQLANSQLVAEKEELLKDRIAQQRAHSQLVNDQVTLQSLHEQLNNEYENLLLERETLKGQLRDVKNMNRALNESCERLEAKNKALIADHEIAVTHVKSLNNLRGEHSKLKEDFRNLYTAMEKLKIEYRNLQEDYRKNKIEMNRLSLKETEMQGEMSTRDDKCATMELQISKLNERCEMLMQMNSGLDSNRRSLMDHISLLFSQYHELLTHSLEDKEHYHMEEKLYTDKVNHLYRQKEKLEEKIMEHYRKLESCSTKNRRFGANFVSRIRKAGSELLKNRRSWADDSKQLESGKIYETESGSNDSDASIDDHRVTGLVDPVVLEGDALSLGHPGTRRTVYYTDDLGSPAPSLTDHKLPSSTPLSHGRLESIDGLSSQQEQSPRLEIPPCEPRPFLIYNKVSAVINESKNMSTGVKEETRNDEIPAEPQTVKEPKTRNPVWYEYGCV